MNIETIIAAQTEAQAQDILTEFQGLQQIAADRKAEIEKLTQDLIETRSRLTARTQEIRELQAKRCSYNRRKAKRFARLMTA